MFPNERVLCEAFWEREKRRTRTNALNSIEIFVEVYRGRSVKDVAKNIGRSYQIALNKFRHGRRILSIAHRSGSDA